MIATAGFAREVKVLVVGAGPAGLAAATAAANSGAEVLLLDDNSAPGGQIWRNGIDVSKKGISSLRRKTIADFQCSKAEVLYGRAVFDAPYERTVRTYSEASGEIEAFAWKRLVLATGARERFLPFPGWTLPGVFGVGGLQALVKGGYSVQGKRVIVAGTGPLLLAVAAYLQDAGAEIVTVAEQSSLASLIPFAAGLLGQPAKLLQGTRYRAALGDVPYRTGCWPVAAKGIDKLRAVTLTDGNDTWTEDCDLLACGFHLVPNTELAMMLGCALAGDFIAVDESQRTTQPDIYCVGEPTGIAGLDAALVQGRIAGLAAVDKDDEAAALYRLRDREQSFGRRLDRAFTLRPELRTLAQPDTIVCRCEDVRYEQLQPYSTWTDAKLQTRCGMGPCQGRICGPAVQTLFGWRNNSVRPPVFPIPLAALTTAASTTSHEITELQETL
jgi:NADPH-dependent 2,4-dienoyl-CoA reductase/sulfur reductase-like enzyme